MTQNSMTIKEYMNQDAIISSFREILGNETSAFVRSVLIAVAQSEQLQKCTPLSIVTAAMRAATLRLSCDPTTKEAYLVPYKDRATLIVGYKGIYTLAIRTGKYQFIHVSTVYEGENLIEDRLTGMHSWGEGKRISNKPAGYLLYFKMTTGFTKTFYMTVEEIEAHAKKYSKSFGDPKSPWTTDKEKMAQKTVLRMGLLRWGYFDPHDSSALTEAEREPEEMIDVVINEPAEYQEPEPEYQYTEAEILEQLGF